MVTGSCESTLDLMGDIINGVFMKEAPSGRGQPPSLRHSLFQSYDPSVAIVVDDGPPPFRTPRIPLSGLQGRLG